MQTSIRFGLPPFKVVSALPTEHSSSFQPWNSLPIYRWIASVPQIQMRGLCTITKQSDNTPVWNWTQTHAVKHEFPAFYFCQLGHSGRPSRPLHCTDERRLRDLINRAKIQTRSRTVWPMTD